MFGKEMQIDGSSTGIQMTYTKEAFRGSYFCPSLLGLKLEADVHDMASPCGLPQTCTPSEGNLPSPLKQAATQTTS